MGLTGPEGSCTVPLMDTSDINYVVFDDQRSFPLHDEPGVVKYCRTAGEFVDYMRTNPNVDILCLDYYLAWETTEAAIKRILAWMETDQIVGPSTIYVVTSSPSDGRRLEELCAPYAHVVSDPDGRQIGLMFQ